MEEGGGRREERGGRIEEGGKRREDIEGRREEGGGRREEGEGRREEVGGTIGLDSPQPGRKLVLRFMLNPSTTQRTSDQ